MSPEHPRDVAELFEAAFGRQGSDRAAFLDLACAGNRALRAEVEELLQWHERAESGSNSLLPAPVTAQTVAAMVRASSLGRGRFGSFSVESKLGEGSTAIVYRAIDTRNGGVVALKVGSARTLLDPAARRRFEQAAAATVGLRHPHIARVLDSGVEEDVPWLALEFVEGRTLAELLRGERPDLATALRLGRQVAGALAAAHEQGIIHRDLKPANILIGRDGDAKVLDFGLCHAAPGRDTIAGTQSGFLLGTPGYMAPNWPGA
jgi:eukaryotic-like serine/threonine-protein kinase